eukprot:9357193-Alexandrium_andersonii.AAC.1
MVPLSQLLNGIEKGLPWPTDTEHVLCAHVAKTPEASVAARDYRVLSILSVLYRTWAKLRLREAREWTTSWAPSGLYAGVPGVGAQDAWFDISCRVEAAACQGRVAVATALDLFKAFDMTNRHTVGLL